MPTIELTEEMLKSNGWAYLFDLSHLKGSQNEDAINEHIRNIYLSAVEALSKQRSKKLKKGPFVIWNCLRRLVGDNNQPTDGYVLIVTPFYHEVAGRDVDPIVEKMWQHKGYIRASSAIPILEGAVPACLFEDGQAYPIELDEEFFSQLSNLFEEHQYMLSLNNYGMELRSNPYEN
ncbi:hypothetical protein [Paenibacillus agricola]|uniref:Uncharacterized protein n=1 Tax=Paenibacillus agricola TaxID=2716264 RepID=A0ABX0JFT0_9BACL|nr:hypothetical protein [Paenibacillus agricola]NHN34383.1 hypothetical protein [Paenibacillus agricola]